MIQLLHRALEAVERQAVPELVKIDLPSPVTIQRAEKGLRAAELLVDKVLETRHNHSAGRVELVHGQKTAVVAVNRLPQELRVTAPTHVQARLHKLRLVHAGAVVGERRPPCAKEAPVLLLQESPEVEEQLRCVAHVLQRLLRLLLQGTGLRALLPLRHASVDLEPLEVLVADFAIHLRVQGVEQHVLEPQGPTFSLHALPELVLVDEFYTETAISPVRPVSAAAPVQHVLGALEGGNAPLAKFPPQVGLRRIDLIEG
mmetsp:Transcript_103805/g.300252  ORF Transcript_103805/g.300252 Transcript_103805/m.300252 type:complete len:258 (-) Transcript_103805:464-1237(-)